MSVSGSTRRIASITRSLNGPSVVSSKVAQPIGLKQLSLSNADKQSEETGDVPFLTEYGATDDLETIGRIVRLADAHMTSWQYWHYCACDDPTTSGPGVQALVVDAHHPPHGANVKRQKLRTLARPYPRAVAGTPRSFSFDPATRRFELVYSTRAPHGRRLGHRLGRRVPTEVFLPRIQYPGGYAVHATGADVLSSGRPRVLKLRRRAHADAVTVVVTPKR